MVIKTFIESIGLTAEEMKSYLIDEVEEFLKTTDKKQQVEEFHDIILALRNLSYSHTGKHIKIDHKIYENKIEDRLKKYATISKKEPIFSHPDIKKLQIGIVHIAFGTFQLPWSQFDPYKNGTEVEIVMLSSNEFKKPGNYTNQVIITFDNVSELEFSFLSSNWNRTERNTILCRIPDFIFERSKKKNNLNKMDNLLSYQVYAALKQLKLRKDCILHFHSWESGLSLKSKEFGNLIKDKSKYFSPYLTVSRLKDFLDRTRISNATLSVDELKSAVRFEKTLIKSCNKIIVESDNDKNFYKRFGGMKVKKYSFSPSKKCIVQSNKPKNKRLTFITGGRAVYEKGFKELLRETPLIIKYAEEKGFDFKLKIFCKEYNIHTKKLRKAEYIDELYNLIKKFRLGKYISVLDKVSLINLRKEIKNSEGLIVPSLYDPYCLMPHYAIDANKICFVSKHTGISENIKSKGYIFDPLKRGSLLNAIKSWISHKEDFVLENNNVHYKTLYLE